MQLPQTGQPDDSRPTQPSEPSEPEEGSTIEEKVTRACQQVYDPEIPINIYELGLIYKIDVSEDGKQVVVDMTLTTPNCPEAQSLPQMVQSVIESIDEVESAHVNIVWEPMWNKDMMSDAAKLQLGLI